MDSYWFSHIFYGFSHIFPWNMGGFLFLSSTKANPPIRQEDQLMDTNQGGEIRDGTTPTQKMMEIHCFPV